jgi:hypothetical protein
MVDGYLCVKHRRFNQTTVKGTRSKDVLPNVLGRSVKVHEELAWTRGYKARTMEMSSLDDVRLLEGVPENCSLWV